MIVQAYETDAIPRACSVLSKAELEKSSSLRRLFQHHKVSKDDGNWIYGPAALHAVTREIGRRGHGGFGTWWRRLGCPPCYLSGFSSSLGFLPLERSANQ